MGDSSYQNRVRQREREQNAIPQYDDPYEEIDGLREAAKEEAKKHNRSWGSFTTNSGQIFEETYGLKNAVSQLKTWLDDYSTGDGGYDNVGDDSLLITYKDGTYALLQGGELSGTGVGKNGKIKLTNIESYIQENEATTAFYGKVGFYYEPSQEYGHSDDPKYPLRETWWKGDHEHYYRLADDPHNEYGSWRVGDPSDRERYQASWNDDIEILKKNGLAR